MSSEETEATIDRLGGRKFILALLSLVAGLLTHAFSAKGLSTEVVAMIVGLVGTFSIANTVSTVKGIQAPEPEETREPTYTIAVGKDGNVVDHAEQLARIEVLCDKIAGIETTTEAIGKSALQTQDILVKALQSRS